MTSQSPATPLARTLVGDLGRVEPGSSVRITGWIHRRRRLSQLSFLILRDRSGLGQVVVRDEQTLAQLDSLGEESVVEVVGTASANTGAPGGVEVESPCITALSEPALTPPIELWRPEVDAGLPTLLDHASVTWRHPRRQALWQIARASLAGFRGTLDSLDFTEVASPKLVESATESGANVFGVTYFDRQAYLAQSPQFYKQLLVGVFERVYEVGPVFRAEPHDTVRHLAEYLSLDVEMGFIHDHRDVIELLRQTFTGMSEAVRSRAATPLRLLGIAVPEVPAQLPVLHFRDALSIAGAAADEPDLAPAHERAVGEWALREHGSEYVVVEGYPTANRAFYTHPDPTDPRWSRSFDLLFRGVELVSGAQRLHRYEDYVHVLAERGYEYAPYASYVEGFRYGIPPHGGFAIGLERWVAQLTGVGNIREVTLFPRDLHRLTP